MSTPADARRRWFGTFYLVMAIGMLIWGQTVLKPYLEGVAYLFYWLGCFAFTGLALLVALWDLWVVRTRIRNDQKALFERTFFEEDAGGKDEEEKQTRARHEDPP